MYFAFALSAFAFLSTSAAFSDLPTTVQKPSPSASKLKDGWVEATPLKPFSPQLGIWPHKTIHNNEGTFSRVLFSDSLLRDPSLFASEQGSPTISIRGSGAAGRITGLVNGVNLNLADGLGARRLFFPVEVVEKTSVLMNPASTYLGTGALGGAISFSVEPTTNKKLRVGIADFGSRNILTSWGQKEVGQISYFHDHTNGDFEYNLQSAEAGGKRVRNDKSLQRVVAVSDSSIGNWQLQTFGLFAQEVGSHPGMVGQAASNFKDTGSVVSVAMTSSRFSFGQFSQSVSRVGLDSEFGPTEGYSSTSRFESRTNWKKQFVDDLELEFFNDLIWDEFTSSYTIDSKKLTQTRAEPGFRTRFSAFDDWILEAGSRYSSSVESFANSLGISREISGHVVQLGYSEGYRIPSLTDLHANAPTFQGNSRLEPEGSGQIQASFQRESQRLAPNVLEHFGYSVQIYRTDFRNYWVSEDLGSGVFSKRNAAAAQVDGFELSMNYEDLLADVTLSYTYTDAVDANTKERLVTSPEQKARLILVVYWGPLAFENHLTHSSTYFVQDFSSNSRRELPGWTKWDFQLSTVRVGSTRAVFGVRNITNQPIELSLGYPERQRFWYCSLEYEI
ncbi:MAG: hypothetical protein COT74_05090 [Bdellovibrionales bacterium CG10_big_fil_rev_8_21_14_0_10_45_34]|nr:MAG: hypothetical protein COT74_05090 [Bdellovibrionales bacterium CG10_big_fil_rev_8_21_14_0_10_45_34]